MSCGNRVRKRSAVLAAVPTTYKKPTTRTTKIATVVAGASTTQINTNLNTTNTTATTPTTTTRVITRGREKPRVLPANKEKVALEKVLAAAEVVMPSIKIEALHDNKDHDNNNVIGDVSTKDKKKLETHVNIDIKPDVNFLEQQMLLQLQQKQQQQQQQQQQFLRVLVANQNLEIAATTTTHIAPDGKRLIALTPANINRQFVQSTAAAVATTAPVVPLTSMSKFTIMDAFEKDEFDLQTSDSDEDGYSDIDLYPDDDLIEDNYETDIYDPVWKNQPKEQRMVYNFVATEVGMHGKPKVTDPLFYFDAVLGGHFEFFSYLALSCNQRAQLLLQKNNVGQMYLKQITTEELQVFLALCLEMCNLKLPTIADYWNSKSFSGFQGFANYMSLSRFQLLLRALNFDNFPESTISSTAAEPLGDLRKLLAVFNERMSNIYTCGQRLVLNEPMTFWKGRMHWSHNLSKKFRCNALNLHFLTEQTGLILKIVPDVDRPNRKEEHRGENSRILMTHRSSIAKELLHDNLNNGRCIYVSKYYGSYGLTYDLARQATYCTSFLDQKRYGNSKQLVLKSLIGNLHATKYAGAIMMGKWRRKDKYAYFCSSDCLAIYPQESFIRGGGGRLKIIKELDWQLKAPQNITEAMLNYQIALDRNAIKWDRNVMIYILNIFILNAFVLYCTYAQFGRARVLELHLKDTSKLKSYAEFRQDIVKSLLHSKDLAPPADTVDHGDEQQQGTKKKSTVDTKIHVPMMIPRRDGKIMKKRCLICRRGGLLTLTQYCCETCTGMPGLCQVPCFEIWHDQINKQLLKLIQV